MRIEVQVVVYSDEIQGDPPNVFETLEAVPDKVITILSRRPCICTAPEDADILRDKLGSRIGTVSVEVRSEAVQDDNQDG